MKKLLTITILSLFLAVPVISFSAYNDVSLASSDTILSVGGISLTVSGGSAATLDSITVGGDNFEVTMSGGASIQVTSSDRRTFSVSGAMGSASQSFSCSASESVLALSNPASGAQITLTVTPNSSVCSVAGGGGGASGGGGGGGSAPTIPSQTAAVVPATPATPAVPTVSPATPAVPSSAAQPSVVALTVSPAFNRTLKIGMSHPDVKRLQQILNSDSDTKVAESGAGSLGKETNYFGPATKKALQKFQAKYGIVSSGDEATTGYGLLGPATRAKLAEAFSEGVSVPTAKAAAKPSAVAPAVSPIFTQGLSRGISGSDVKRLQQILNSDSDTKVAESGVGSLGKETNYFGSATEKAVQKFQMKHGIVQSASDSGYGYLGPKTRAKIQEIFEKAEAPATGVQQPTETVKPATAAASEIQKQISDLLEQIKTLQEQMKKL